VRKASGRQSSDPMKLTRRAVYVLGEPTSGEDTAMRWRRTSLAAHFVCNVELQDRHAVFDV
jgi:hypothetical protein